jgi:DNA-directed RNA polymerase specialized sigma24 family protein
MKWNQIESAYHMARERWQKVVWRIEDYRTHVEQKRNGNKLPAFPVDLYLSGSAGYRLQEAWEVIEKEMGPEVIRVMQHKPRAALTAEEIWSRARTQLIGEAKSQPALPDGRLPAKIIAYRGDVRLLNYIITAAINVARAEHRKPKPVSWPDDGGFAEVIPDGRISPDMKAAEAEMAGKIKKELSRTWLSMNEQERFLVRMVFYQGMKRKEAGRLAGLGESTTSRLLNRIIARFTAAIKDMDTEMSTDVLRDTLRQIMDSGGKAEPQLVATNKQEKLS